MMNIPCAWTLSNGSPDIIVAVYDSYLADDHDDLQGKVVAIHEGFGMCNPANANEHHGTQSLGAIAAIRNNSICIAGTGGDTRVAGYCTPASNNPIADAVNRGYSIISISSWFPSSTTQAGVRYATENGAVVVVGQYGNYHENYQDVPGVIVVGRTDLNGNFWQYHPTNTDTFIDVMAVTNQLNRLIEVNECGLSDGGTSIGVPAVAGVVALMRSANPCLAPEIIEDLLKQTANPVPSNTPPGAAEAGIINAYAAVQAVLDFQPVDVVWSGTQTIANRHISGNLTVKSGAVVTVEGNVYFGEGSKMTIEAGARVIVTGSLNLAGNKGIIIVKRGAVLTVDGGTLKNSYCAGEWGGVVVEGNINKEQKLPGQSTDLTVAGVLELKNGALVKNARTAFSTNPHHLPSPNADYHGGLIIASDATFKNCKVRAAEFTPYQNYENKSSFTNVTFDGALVAAATHWGVKGVKYDGCTFKNYEQKALITYNAAISVVNGCTFDNGGMAEPGQPTILLTHTSPNFRSSRIGNINTTPNFFYGGYHNIRSTTGNNTEKIHIENNQFIGAKVPVYMDGVNNFNIEYNDFIGNETGSRLVATGLFFNQEKNNQFSACDVGIYCHFQNDGYRFLINCFDNTKRKDFILAGQPTGTLIPGTIYHDQGNVVHAASNCFSTGFPKGITVKDNGQIFNYYIPTGTPPSSCLVPPGYAGNKFEAQDLWTIICGSQSTPGPIDVNELPCPLPNDPEQVKLLLLQLTVELYNLEQQLAGTAYPSTAWYQLRYQIIQRQQCIQKLRKHLILLEGAAQNYASLTQFFSGGEFVYKTYIFGAMVENKDYTIARNYLNSLTTATEEQADFVFTQNINLDRLEINNYQLAGEAQAQLYTIAKKPYPLSGYARSLYFVLTDELLDVDLPKDEDPFEERSSQTAETQGMKITSGPNPSGDTYEIRFDRPLETPYMVQVYGLDGRPVHLTKADKGDGRIEIKTGSWPTGVYFVKVSNTATGELLHSTKLVKH